MKIVAAFLLALAVTGVHAAQWQMVPSKSQLKFVATYEGQQAPGVFRRFQVKLNFDENQPQNGSLQVIIDTASADMNSSDINKAIKGPEWFSANKYPKAEFASRQIRRETTGHYIAKGTLDLKGVEKTVQAPFTWQPSGDTATMKGHIVLRRTDFNIGTGEWSSGKTIGLDVTLDYTVQLQRVRDSGKSGGK